MKTLSLLLACALALHPLLAAAAESPAPAAASDKEARLKQLVELLKTFSDDDYKTAIQQAGADLSSHPELGSREAALKTGYTTLAALEYHQAAGRGEKDYARIAKDDADAVAIDPSTMQETGRGWEILKMAAKAALKYGIMTAIMAAGSEVKSPEDQALDKTVSESEQTLSNPGAKPDAKQDAHYALAQAYEKQAGKIGGAGAEAPSQKRVWLRKVATFLEAISDEDYHGALEQALQEVPNKGKRAPLLASRAGALQATYTDLAELEYAQAMAKDPGTPKYADAYKRAAAGRDVATVDPQNVQETGWVVDVLKFLANAAINYELEGGAVFVGRDVRPAEVRKLDAQMAEIDKRLADPGLGALDGARLNFELGEACEQRAKLAAGPDTKAEKTAKKEAKIARLAELLQSVSDEEYVEALERLPEDKAKRPELKERKTLLRGAYTTLAGLEYHQAGASADYKRVAGDDVSRLAINPDTLQETGWFSDLLGAAALGGIGYLVYDSTRKGHRGPAPQPFIPAPSPAPAPGPKPVYQAPPPPIAVPHPPMPPRVHCMAFTPGCGYARPIYAPASAEIASLNEAAAGARSQLASYEIDEPKAAELHKKLGGIYEQLLAQVDQKKAAPAVEKPQAAPEKSDEERMSEDIQDLEKSAKDLQKKAESAPPANAQ